AIIVRGFNPTAPGGGGGGGGGDTTTTVAADGKALVVADPLLTLEARSPGLWSNTLRARVDYQVAPGDNSLFNLYVALVKHDSNGKPLEVSELEVFRNVSLLTNHPRRIDNVLEAESKLVKAKSFTPQTDDTKRPKKSDDPDPTNTDPTK